jgi:RNA polymerase sigma-70 factor (ECF subfamily)
VPRETALRQVPDDGTLPGPPGRRDTGAEAREDDALLARIAGGDTAAWRLRSVTGLAWHMLHDATEAEDVAQEAFLRLMAKVNSWEPGRAALRTWLTRVTVNLCIDRQRRANRAPVSIDTIDPPATEPGIEHRIDIAVHVGRAVASLAPRQRAALTLVHYQGMTNIEASAVLGVTVDALESLLARARRAMRQTLQHVVPDLLGEL